MAQVPPVTNLSLANQLAQDTDTNVKAMQKNALSKQYNLVLKLEVTETASNKPYFVANLDYTGVPYPFVVILQNELVLLEQKLVALAKEVATGGESESPPPT